MVHTKNHFLPGYINFKQLFARRHSIDSQEPKEPLLLYAWELLVPVGKHPAYLLFIHTKPACKF